MELRQLASLEAVLETGSFAAAARARHVAQPALWAQVKGLERELDVPLFERVGRGVRPTAAALALRERVRRVLEDLRRLGAFAAELKAGRALPAVLGCAPYSVPHLLAGCFETLQRRHPDLPLPVVVPITSSSGPGALARADLDLAVMPFVEELDFDGERLYPVWISVLGRGVPSGAPFDVRRLDGQPVATLPPDTAVGMLLRHACREAGVSPRIVLETRDVASLQAFASRGLATSVVVSDALGPEGARKAARLALGKRTFEVELWLYRRRGAALTLAAEQLRGVMLEAARARRPDRPRPAFWPLPAAAAATGSRARR